MNAMTVKTPWHLWVVGLLALAWNGFGAWIYVMTMMQGASFMASMQMTPAQIEYQLGLPAWMDALWAVGVWGGVLAAVLLLMRSKWAAVLFVLSLIAMVATAVANFLSPIGREAMGGEVISTSVITVIGVIFVLYCRLMIRKGVLR